MEIIKKIIVFTLVILSNCIFSQTLEIGTKIGTTASSIDDSDFFNDKPSIGKKLWSVNYGIHSIYYFKNPKETKTGAIVFEFNNRKLGVKSKSNNSTYEIDSKSVEIVYRMCAEPDKIGRFFLDVGLGINFLKEDNIYKGSVEPTIAFEKLSQPLLIKDKDYKLVLGLGYDFVINKKLVTYFQLDACGGFTNINKNSGSYINTYFSLNTGLRYTLEFKKK
jgi:hypothetical protein